MRFILLLVIMGARAWSCSCGVYASAKDAWLESALVLTGVVERTDLVVSDPSLAAGEQVAWVRVTEPFKGVKKDQVLEVRAQFSSCFGGYRAGSAMVFYLFPGERQGSWIARLCHRTRAIDGAVDDLTFLRGLPGSAHGNRVSGVVELWEDDPIKSFHKNRALIGVRIRASGSRGSHETFTGPEGFYEFRNLEPGTYTITADYPKGTALRFPIGHGRNLGRRRSGVDESTKLEVTAESGNGFDFLLSPDTRISGRVSDPDGRPMKDVCIRAESLTVDSGKPSGEFDCTAADGTYELRRLSAGSYRIVANREGRSSGAAPFGRLYHPGTAAIEQARTVTITAGQYVEGIDIRVPELAGRIELRGRLAFSDGVPAPGQMLKFEAEERYSEYGRTDANGSFSIRILAGRPGKLVGDILAAGALARKCPQFAAALGQNSRSVFLQSTPFPVAGDRSITGIEVVFPFPSCAAWLEEESNRMPR